MSSTSRPGAGSSALGVCGRALTGCALWLRSNPARSVGLVITTTNVIVQLGFAGGNHYPLWGLVGIALNVVILYALTVHWHGSEGHAQ